MFKDDAATQKQLDDINGKIDLIDKQIESVNTQKIVLPAKFKLLTKNKTDKKKH